MGFYVDTAEMLRALEEYQKMSRKAQEQLTDAQKGMTGILDSQAMYGQVGQAITADINNNKNAVLVGLKDSYKLVEAELQQTYEDFQATTGETSNNAILSEETLIQVKSDINQFKAEHQEQRREIESIYNDISDLLPLEMPSDRGFIEACEETQQFVDEIIENVHAFDRKQPTSSSEELIAALSHQIKLAETASDLSYTDPQYLAFVNQTDFAEGIKGIDNTLTQIEKEAKKKQDQWAKDHLLENGLRQVTEEISS